MSHGICTLPIVPCRAESSDPSEMVTQLLFGETFELIDVQEKWTRVRLDADAYECWVDNKQITQLKEDDYKRLTSSTPFQCAELFAPLGSENGQMQIPIGSRFPGLKDGTVQIAGKPFTFNGLVIDTSIERKPTVPNIARLFMNAPYLWGGRSPAGIDCSGFTQVVFSLAGISLPRDAYQQAERGVRIELENAGSSDLAFFHNDIGRITHVGIVLDGNKVIHASGKVRIDQLTPKGIQTEDGTITHDLTHISRI